MSGPASIIVPFGPQVQCAAKLPVAWAIIRVPLLIRGRALGTLKLVATNPRRRYTERELQLAENFADRVATAVDNSQLVDALKEDNRQKDELLAMPARERRNRLAAIRYAAALGRMPDGEAPAELFDLIERRTNSLAHLVDDQVDMLCQRAASRGVRRCIDRCHFRLPSTVRLAALAQGGWHALKGRGRLVTRVRHALSGRATQDSHLERRADVDAGPDEADRIRAGILRDSVAVPVLEFERQPGVHVVAVLGAARIFHASVQLLNDHIVVVDRRNETLVRAFPIAAER